METPDQVRIRNLEAELDRLRKQVANLVIVGSGLTAEDVRDVIGAALVAGTNVTITVDDPGDTITVDSTGGSSGLTAEDVRDVIGTALVAGTGATITVDDPGDTITVSFSDLWQYSGGILRPVTPPTTKFLIPDGSLNELLSLTSSDLAVEVPGEVAFNAGGSITLAAGTGTIQIQSLMDVYASMTPTPPADPVFRFFVIDNAGTLELHAMDPTGADFVLAPGEAISDLDAADPLDGTELVAVEQSGDTVQTTTQDIADFANAGDSYAAASVSGSITVDYSAAKVNKLTLTGNVTATTVSNTTNGAACSLTLYLVQDGTGSRTFAFPSGTKWPNGVAPTLTTTANATDIVVLETFDGATSWYANLAGRAYA